MVTHRVALPQEYQRYLRLLGFTHVPTGLEGLRGLIAAHLGRVPFENVSKLLLYAREGKGRPFTLNEYLDGIEHYDLGGTCYSSNLFLFELLRALGYDAKLLSADMSSPDVHSSIRVHLHGVEYHVDVGYAAPFCYPMPMNRLPHVLVTGPARYELRSLPSRPDTYELVMSIDETRRHGYIVHPPPRVPEFFTGAILASYATESTFMRCLRISRVLNGDVIDLRNRTLMISRNEAFTVTTIADMNGLRLAVSEVLQMPRCRIEDAVTVLQNVTGLSFFGDERWADSLD